jgi:hypothetical protein
MTDRRFRGIGRVVVTIAVTTLLDWAGIALLVRLALDATVR